MKPKRQRAIVFRKQPQDHLFRLYRFLEKYKASHGYMPSTYEVAARFQTRHTTVRYWYGLMEEQKMLRLHPGLSRAVVLLPLEEQKEKI